MNTEQKDKFISVLFLLISVSLVIYGIGLAGFENPLTGSSFLKFLLNLSNQYFDFILIGYIFICLQIAGYYELKYQKDYLTMSIISILLTPLSLLFIRPSEHNSK
jgi:hypothetical protein